MPRAKPHPLALFSLVPKNERAERVVAHPCNEHLTSWLEKGKLGLDVGHIRSKSGSTTLATLGRGDADVFVEGSSIAKIQCSFDINLDTKVVMFYDRSHSQTSQVFGDNAFPFEYGRVRKVVVQKDVNTIVGMGGVGRNLIQLELKWHYSSNETMQIIKNREHANFSYVENPRLARTVDEADTVPCSRWETRPHTAGSQQLKLRYATIAELGSGQFGDVYKAVELDSGKLLAVKILRRPKKTSDRDWRTLLHNNFKREVDILSQISHPHIVDYIASYGWSEGEVEIFMGLKEGTLESLVTSGCSTPINDLSTTVLHHTLQAIDFLTTQGIIHRDVKPENILFISQSSQYHFQLGDFGLSNRQITAATFVGSLLYMAPELFQQRKQTDKADIWSLYVTMLWTLDVEGFRDVSKKFKTPEDARATVLSVASGAKSVSIIREMARPEPEERASAAQMLVKCYNGEGLTTPRNQILPLTDQAKALSKATPGPAAVLSKRLRPARNKNSLATAGQFRVEKAWHLQPYQRPPSGAVEKNVQVQFS